MKLIAFSLEFLYNKVKVDRVVIMKKLNEKGFAVAVILYASATILVLVLILILSVLSTSSKNTLSLVDMVKEQVSGVTGDALQLYNLTTNGGFENHAVAWSTSISEVTNSLTNQLDPSVFHSGKQSLKVSPNGLQWQSLKTVNLNDQIYVGSFVYMEEVKSGAFDISIVTRNGSSLPVLSGSSEISYPTDGFIHQGVIYQVTDTELLLQVGASKNANISAYVDDIVVVNLTKIFGSSKEPSVEWCNSNIKYFNGVMTITNYDSSE